MNRSTKSKRCTSLLSTIAWQSYLGLSGSFCGVDRMNSVLGTITWAKTTWAKAGAAFVLFVGFVCCLPANRCAAAPSRDGGNDYGISQVNAINQHIRRGWQENKLVASPSATDAEWCRRVYL